MRPAYKAVPLARATKGEHRDQQSENGATRVERAERNSCKQNTEQCACRPFQSAGCINASGQVLCHRFGSDGTKATFALRVKF